MVDGEEVDALRSEWRAHDHQKFFKREKKIAPPPVHFEDPTAATESDKVDLSKR